MPLVDLIESFGRAGKVELFGLIEDYEKDLIEARKEHYENAFPVSVTEETADS